jgi:single-strand selective monofunctional uracil DNA glycosylase
MASRSRSEGLSEIADALCNELGRLTFGAPTTHVYNPLLYAREPHRRYNERWGQAPRRTLLLGMNPGPFGMAQTGVPFGDVAMVRDWLGITGRVDKPPREHPARPIHGFDCPRGEVSGSRLWGWARDTFGTPDRFFERFFVVNYCPLVFMEESGKNRTPDKLPAAEKEPLLAACDRALRRIVDHLGAELVIGVGVFAEESAERAVGDRARIGRMLHPSPASPRANANWAAQATSELRALGVPL